MKVKVGKIRQFLKGTIKENSDYWRELDN